MCEAAVEGSSCLALHVSSVSSKAVKECKRLDPAPLWANSSEFGCGITSRASCTAGKECSCELMCYTKSSRETKVEVFGTRPGIPGPR